MQPQGSLAIGRLSGESSTWETPASSSCSRPLSFLHKGADLFCVFANHDAELEWETSEHVGKREQEEIGASGPELGSREKINLSVGEQVDSPSGYFPIT